jgi:Pyruvate/2-oxoacid:ferredoxin oxidoreductase delta subunit
VAEVSLQRAGIDAVIRQLVTAGVTGGWNFSGPMIRLSLDDQCHVCIHYFPAEGRSVAQGIFLTQGPMS